MHKGNASKAKPAEEKTTKAVFEDSEPVPDPAAAMQKSPRTMYNEYLAANAVSQQRHPLPTARMDDPHYVAAAELLRKTKAEIEAANADLAVLNTIVDLPIPDDVRRTVAKIFADPRHATAISDAEWKRREAQYRRSREKFGERVTDMLARQRQHMSNQMAKLDE